MLMWLLIAASYVGLAAMVIIDLRRHRRG